MHRFGDQTGSHPLQPEAPAFMAAWDLLSLKQKQVLTALAEAGQRKHIFASDFIQEYKLGAASSVEERLEA